MTREMTLFFCLFVCILLYSLPSECRWIVKLLFLYKKLLVCNKFLSLGKVTGGRPAPSTQERKVTSPVTMWHRLTPYRLKSKNSNCCSNLLFVTVSAKLFHLFSWSLASYSLVLHPTKLVSPKVKNAAGAESGGNRWCSYCCSSGLTET